MKLADIYINMKSIRFIFGLLLMAISFGHAGAAETAGQMMERAAAKINAAGGLSANFMMTSGQYTSKGSMKAEGRKFCIISTQASTWYDGKTLWTYNANTKETTVVNPTESELAETNPLALVNSYGNSFTAAFAKSHPKGGHTIVLTPKSKKLGYKSVHVTISDATGLPASVVVVPSSGTRISISISEVKTKQKFSSATFSYSKSKYPKAEIVDMR